RTIHPVGAQLALECIAFMSPSFLCWRFNTTYRVPTYQAWLEGQDLLPAYRFHREFLQQLQWRGPARRWVLKAPSPILAFGALLRTYPAARTVEPPRDRLTVLASVGSLPAVLHAASSNRLDLAEIGREVSRRWTHGIERALHFRRSGRVSPDRFLDVHYHDLIRDPLSVARRIYSHFGIPFTEIAETRMRRVLARTPQGKDQPTRYSLGTFALDADDLTRRFKAYREYFGIPAEPAIAR